MGRSRNTRMFFWSTPGCFSTAERDKPADHFGLVQRTGACPQKEASGCEALRITWGVCPNMRGKLRRIRSRSPKPVSRPISSTGRRPCSSMNLAASSRRFSMAFAGDRPVSALNTRPNCRGLRHAASASFSNVNSRPDDLGMK